MMVWKNYKIYLERLKFKSVDRFMDKSVDSSSRTFKLNLKDIGCDQKRGAGDFLCCCMLLKFIKTWNCEGSYSIVNICRPTQPEALLRCWFEVLCSAYPGLQHHRNIGRVLPQQTSHWEPLDSVSTNSSVFNHQENKRNQSKLQLW